jgi:hypothetical protein
MSTAPPGAMVRVPDAAESPMIRSVPRELLPVIETEPVTGLGTEPWEANGQHKPNIIVTRATDLIVGEFMVGDKQGS